MRAVEENPWQLRDVSNHFHLQVICDDKAVCGDSYTLTCVHD